MNTAELLKNELYRRTDLELYDQTWKVVFERDEDTKRYWELPITSGRTRRQNVDLFLQSFLTIRSGADEEYGRVEDLFGSYKRFLKKSVANKNEFVRDLQRTAEVYRERVEPELLDETIDRADRVDRLVVVLLGLNITTVFPYLLYLLREVEDGDELNRLVGLLETFLVRRVTCRETSKNYNNLFASFIRNGVNTYENLAARLTASMEPTTRIPSDLAFQHEFQEANLTNQQARVVLYLLETATRDSSRHNTSLLGLLKYSLEHVMPKKWRNHWGKEVSPAEAESRDEALRKLGKLTLLTSSLNSAIRDAAWMTKRKGHGQKPGLETYARGLEIFDQELEHNEWTCQAIVDRGRRLAALALKAWPYPAAAPTVSLSGEWRTRVGDGDEWLDAAVTLRQNGARIDGTYQYDDDRHGVLEGTLSGNQFVGVWKEDGTDSGPANFAFARDGQSFEGRWDWPSRNGAQWRGNRTGARDES